MPSPPIPNLPIPDVFDKLFSIAGGLVLPVWLLLIFVPRWQWTQRLATFIVPLLLGVIYVGLLATAHFPAGGGFNSLAQVALLFSVRQALLAGWIHYLAFDLFTGAWEARDARRLRISRWLVAPCLLLTFLFGPLGLGLYLLLRAGLRKKVGVVLETAAP
jgi:hypothetical protein